MRAVLLAVVLAFAAVSLAPTAAACHPYHIMEYDLDGATIYYWVDAGCPHVIPFVCVVVVPDGGPFIPVCV